MTKRVVVTGLGPVTPVGLDKDTFFHALLQNRSHFRTVSRYSTERCVAKLGAEIDVFVPSLISGKLSKPPEGFTGLDISQFVHSKTIAKVERFDVPFGGWSLYYGIAAAKKAVADAALDFTAENLERVGCVVGAASGDVQLIRYTKPRFEVTQYGAMGGISGAISFEFGLQGVGIPIAGACASGTLSLRSGAMEIMAGHQDVMLVGAVSAGLASQIFFESCDQPRFGPMSKDNDIKRPMKPFDVERGGFVLGEGAGVLVLESLEHALSRDAHIYCEVAGFGHSTDTATHMADVSIHGYRRSMSAARRHAGLSDAALDASVIHFNTHGTATRKNDKIETQAIREVFGEQAGRFMVNSIKGTTGHAQEASSAQELIAAALVLEHGVVPPTAGLEQLDPECGAGLDIVKDAPREAPVDYVIKSSSGFCGPYCTVVLKRFIA